MIEFFNGLKTLKMIEFFNGLKTLKMIELFNGLKTLKMIELFNGLKTLKMIEFFNRLKTLKSTHGPILKINARKIPVRRNLRGHLFSFPTHHSYRKAVI